MDPQLFPNESEADKTVEDEDADDWAKIDGKHYCGECWEFDYENDYEGDTRKVVITFNNNK